MTNKIERLFLSFNPKNYRLEYDFNFENLTFTAICIISGDIQNASEVVNLHSKELEISSVTMEGCDLVYSQKDEILSISLPKKHVGPIRLEIIFGGNISKAMHGIYPSTSASGDILISTQFESHHAREAFPCIDEPEAKATFDLSINAPKAYTVLSNMPIKSATTSGNLIKTRFNTTPKMSTYLLAFAIGKIHGIKGKTNDGVEVGVWATKDHPSSNLEFALEVGINTIEFLNDYFGVKYPLPKLDQIAIPDFSSGAMENWGLVTYREIALLVDPKKVSTSSKEMVALVIAHELSHQWFGNLVTMKWWDDLWLNESFATLMEYLIIDNLYPEWNVMLNFASHEALSAYRRDILPGVQPVATSVNHPDEISTLFDPSIVYAKGARLLWMVFNLVGEKAFKRGLREYFKIHQYSNTIGKDLWDALGSASGIDISSIMEKWLSQPGLPYLTIGESINGVIALSQSKLTSDGPKDGYLWPIPLWPEQKLPLTVLSQKTKNVKTQHQNIRFNIYGGHFVCKYESKETLHIIREMIVNKSIPADSRLLFLNDCILLSKCGIDPIHQMLDTVSAYKNEDQESVWSVISLTLGDARMLVESNKAAENQLKKYVESLISDKFKLLGWAAIPNESSNDKKLRSILSNLMIYTENPEAIDYALNLYEQTSVNELNSDTRTAVLTAAAKYGNKTIYNELMGMYSSENIADIKLDIGAALASSKNLSNIKKLIGRLKDENFVKLQDVDRFVVYLLRNAKARPLIWQWLTENWNWIEDNFASDKSYDNYPRYAAAAFSTNAWLNEYKNQFIPLSNVTALKRNIEIGIKDIENKIAWRKKVLPDLLTWLKSQ